MKFFILLSIFSLELHAKGIGQGSISLSLKDAPLEQVFLKIRQQSGYDFLYNGATLKNAKKVTIEVKDATVNKVLDICFANQPLTYSIDGLIVIVKPKLTIAPVEQTGTPSPRFDLKGTVINENNEPIEGVSVKIKASTTGTLTNAKGEFELDAVNENSTIQISHVSYETIDIIAKYLGGSITLKAKFGNLSAITINTGYQMFKANDVTGSAVTVREDQLDQRVAPDILSKLEGIVNGLVFNKKVDGTNSIRVRGESTIFANPNPLIVVDNFPYDGNISNINPNDIESVTILKDAAAASIWGVQAANGVIVITTKRGKINQPVRIEMNSNFTVVGKPLLYHAPQINSADYVEFETFLFDQGYFDWMMTDVFVPAVSPAVEILNDKRDNLITEEEANKRLNALKGFDVRKQMLKYFYQDALRQQHQINLKGGSSRVGYFFSAGFDKSRSEIIGNEQRRVTLSSQSTFRPLKGIELNVGLFHNQSRSTNNGNGTVNSPNIYPYTQFVDVNGNEVPLRQHRALFEDTITNKGFLDWRYFPLQERQFKQNTTNEYETRALTTLSYSPFAGVRLEMSYQYNKFLTKGRDLNLPGSWAVRNNLNSFAIIDNDGNYIGSNYPAGGELMLSNAELNGNYGRINLNLDKTMGKHSVISMLGLEAREMRSELNTSKLYGYDDQTGSFIIPDLFVEYPNYPSGIPLYIGGERGQGSGLSQTGSVSRFRSYYGNVLYSYLDKYSFSASARFDGTNYFGVKTNQKTVPLWSSGVKWDLLKEKFITLKKFNRLSLRLTYGYNGNLAQNMAAVTTLQYADYNSLYSGLPFAVVNNIPNPNLRWEKTGQFNIGIDFSLKNDRVAGSVEYFRKSGKDLIGSKIMDITTGINRLRGNFSGLQSKGVDVELLFKPVDGRFKWQTSLIVNYVAEKVTRYDVESGALTYLSAYQEIIPQVGKPLYGLWSYQWGGLDPQTGEPRIYLSDTLNKEYDGSSLIQLNDLVFSGRYNPPVAGSLFNSFSWRGIVLGCNITYKLGHKFRRSSINYGRFPDGYQRLHEDFALRWSVPGDELYTDVPALIYPFHPQRESFYNNSTVLVEKADHVRLQFISLSYELPRQLLEKMSLKGMKLNLYANNIGIIWRANKKGIDPDYPYTNYPPSRTFSAGINVTL